MAKCTITLDEQQLARLEQVIVDQDAEAGLKLLREIRRQVLASQGARCDPEKLRASTAVESITGKIKR